MKSPIKALLSLSLIAAMGLASTASATITMNYFFGRAFQTDGSSPIQNNALWIMLADTDDNNSFYGGFGLTQSLHEDGDANSVFTAGQSLSVGQVLGGDTIFAMGGFDNDSFSGPGGTAGSLAGMTLGTNGLATGREYAFYFFGDVTYSGSGTGTFGAHSQNIGSLVGGFQLNVAENGNVAMVIGADISSESHGAFDPGTAPGTLTAGDFTSVALIPEPSALLLTGLGGLMLLRRRRND